MRRLIITALLILIAFLLQTTLFHEIAFGLAAPNLLLILTFIFGFMRGKKSGLLVGLFCGLLIDLFFSEVMGFNALVYMSIGYLNGFFNKIFYDEDVTLPIVLIVVSDLSYNFIIFKINRKLEEYEKRSASKFV